jgi:hypothetical protein
VTSFYCGRPLPKLAERNQAEVMAHWDAYRDQWVDALRANPATFFEIARTFQHMTRTEEFLASALLFIAEGP